MSAGYFHYSVAARSRSGGFNAVLHAAYISGQELFDEREQTAQRWGSAERVVCHEVNAPTDAPTWVRRCVEARDQATLWNRAEAAETRKNSVLYRSINLGIDDACFVRDAATGLFDFDASEKLQAQMVRDHVARNFTDRGMVVSWAIHWDPKEPTKNPHAHIMLSTRLATEAGFGEKEGGEGRPWKENRVEAWRKDWAEVQNEHLKAVNAPYRVDHRSYERQGAPEVEPEDKHFGKRDKQAKNERHHRNQAAKLATNPRPVFDLMGQSFVGSFTSADIDLYVRRFAKTRDDREKLTRGMLASRELIALGEATFTTQGIRAREVQEQLRPTLDRFERIASWEKLDDSLKAHGFRIEAVKRDGKITHDLVRLADPDWRISSYRVDQRLGPTATFQKFNETRVRHELKTIGKSKSAAYRDLRRSVWTRLSTENKHDREDFFAAHKAAMRDHWKQRDARWTISAYVAEKVSRWTWGRKRRRMEERLQKRFEEARKQSEELRAREEREVRRELELRIASLNEPVTKATPEVGPIGKKNQPTSPSYSAPERAAEPIADPGTEAAKLRKRLLALRVEKFTANPTRRAEIEGMLKDLEATQQPTPGHAPSDLENRLGGYAKLPIEDLFRARTLAQERHGESLLRKGVPDPTARALRDEVDQAMLRHPSFLAWKMAHPEQARQVEVNISIQSQRAPQRPTRDQGSEL